MQPRLHLPSVLEIEAAHRVYIEHEARDLFYRAATELIDLARRGTTDLTEAEALAVLLKTWNSEYYRFKGGFTSQHITDIENILNRHYPDLEPFRARSIDSLSDEDETPVKTIFRGFDESIGPVGAAKSLHLLAPGFFPLWDTDIAIAYRVRLQAQGTNAHKYYRFMKMAREQCRAITRQLQNSANVLKLTDEYNYCKYSRRWM